MTMAMVVVMRMMMVERMMLMMTRVRCSHKKRVVDRKGKWGEQRRKMAHLSRGGVCDLPAN